MLLSLMAEAGFHFNEPADVAYDVSTKYIYEIKKNALKMVTYRKVTQSLFLRGCDWQALSTCAQHRQYQEYG